METILTVFWAMTYLLLAIGQVYLIYLGAKLAFKLLRKLAQFANSPD